MTRYYFSEYDIDIECLKNRDFTIDQLKKAFHTHFENELRELGDNETTFESWLNDNLKMALIYKKEA